MVAGTIAAIEIEDRHRRPVVQPQGGRICCGRIAVKTRSVVADRRLR
nr:hypothetical protein [uncultured Halomonas sp.]